MTESLTYLKCIKSNIFHIIHIRQKPPPYAWHFLSASGPEKNAGVSGPCQGFRTALLKYTTASEKRHSASYMPYLKNGQQSNKAANQGLGIY
jgi:hypothetical protein